MTYVLYATTPADVAVTVGAGNELLVAPNTTLTVWDARTGGTQITSGMQDLAGNPITSVTTDAAGGIAFYGDDTVLPREVWLDGGGSRLRVYGGLSEHLTERETAHTTLEQRVTDAESTQTAHASSRYAHGAVEGVSAIVVALGGGGQLFFVDDVSGGAPAGAKPGDLVIKVDLGA